jgi:tetratricopeptide (TPR) repeat protein
MAGGRLVAWAASLIAAAAMTEAPITREAQRAALRRAAAALDDAEREQRPGAMCEALAALAACYRALDALPAAEATLEAALRWARATQRVDGLAELLCKRADVAVQRAWLAELEQPGSGRAARERARDAVAEARRLATRLADPHAEVHVLLCVGDVLMRCGDHDDAERVHAQALALTSLPEVTEWFESRPAGWGEGAAER